MITLVILICITVFSFLPIVGAWIGITLVIKGSKTKWQEDFSDAYLIRGGS
jgi:hypothetical protein